MSIKRVVWFLGLFLTTVSVIFAQNNCPALVATALETVADACDNLARNQVCYGNNQVTALDFAAEPITAFAANGDTIDLTTLASLATAGFDEESAIWGVAVMVLQADLPETLPGQNVTFIVFGDTQLTADDTASDDLAPMQAFSITTGIGAPDCNELPPDGVVIQAPTDTTVYFRINGVDVEIGSTAFVQTVEEGLEVSTFEGSVTVTSDDESANIEPGFWAKIEEGEAPQDPVPYDYDQLDGVPVELLPEAVTIPVPVNGNTTEDWLETDILVAAGDTVTLTARGTVNFWDICETQKEEAGQPEIDCDTLIFGPAGGDPLNLAGEPLPSDMSLFPIPDAPPHSLVGRIGENEFFIGEGGTFTAASDGLLAFRINDVDANNSGAFVVTIERPAEDVEE